MPRRCVSCTERGILLASFFFSRPEKRQLIHRIVEGDLRIMLRTTSTRLKRLIIEPFQCDSPGPALQPRSVPFLIIINGLDECDGLQDQTLIVSLIGDLVKTYNLPIRYLVLSRPEHPLNMPSKSWILLSQTFHFLATDRHKATSVYSCGANSR